MTALYLSVRDHVWIQTLRMIAATLTFDLYMGTLVYVQQTHAPTHILASTLPASYRHMHMQNRYRAQI